MQAKYRTGLWYSATVTEVTYDIDTCEGTYIVSWDDGDPNDTKKKAADLRPGEA